MNVVGVAAEFNPFHLGHALHLRETRALLGEDAAIVCAMSGDFVQRGEAAAFSKFTRAEAACRAAVDLVIELPLPWSLASAEGFARGAVSLLSRIGCTHLSFGSEAGELAPLQAMASLLENESFNASVKERMRSDPSLSYAAARQQLACLHAGETARILEQPNNILAVEYLKAIRALRSGMIPVTVPRTGSAHDGEGGELASASELRKRLHAGMDIASQIPPEAYAVYAREESAGRGVPDPALLEAAVLSRLRNLPEDGFDRIPDAGSGLGRRLCRAAGEEPDLDSLCAAVKSKRYALSRVRRMVFCAALGIRQGMADGLPPYARVLAANARGCEILRRAGKESRLLLVTKPASVRDADDGILRCFALGAAAHDLFVLGYPDVQSRRGGEDWRTGPVIV